MILITGFEKFSEYRKNISEQILFDFPEEVYNQTVIKKVLPVDWKKSIIEYKQIIQENKYNLIILTGVHSGKRILLERFAWNLAFGIDNSYRFRIGPIRIGKPLRLKSMFDFSEITPKVQKISNVAISSYPGFYICNYLYYWALNLAKRKYPVVFIHLPVKYKLEIIKKKLYTLIKLIIIY